MRIALVAAALAMTLLTGAADQRRERVPAATPVGAPVDCVRLRDIRETRVRDDRTIDFYLRSGRILRNDLDGLRCPRLGTERRFSYKTSIGQLCSVDSITVIDQPGLTRGVSCGLGKFQPVTLGR
jgi:hypothetical protein